jgi:C-terminal processing protease CtpA/Prc
MKELILILGIFISISAYSQEKISPENLRNDIDYLIEKYEKIHPNLYAHTDKKYFTSQVDRLKNEITDSMNSFDFWMRLAPIINELKDGHTSISPNYEDVGIYLKKFNSGQILYLPFSVFIVDSIVYLREIYGNKSISIKPGSIIKSINGHSSSEILVKLIGYKSGESFEYRMSYVQRTFLWDYPIFYPSKNYEIVYFEDGILKTSELEGIKDSETEIYSRKIFPELPDYNFKIIDDNVGLLEYNSCTNLDKFRSFLDSTFSIIKSKGISNLVIDLRNNGGGNSDLNELLLTYLYSKPFKSYSLCEVNVTEDIRGLNDYFTQFKHDTTITFDTYKENKPVNKLLFKGNVYLLTSIYTFSSGSQCAMLFKDYDVGTIVGQETGGLPSGFGDSFSFKLPYSVLNASVSYKYFIRPSGKNDGKGVLPDVLIQPTINDLLNNRDLEMDYVLKQIKE